MPSDRDGTGGDRLGGEVVPVDLLAGERHEQPAGRDLAGVVLDRAGDDRGGVGVGQRAADGRGDLGEGQRDHAFSLRAARRRGRPQRGGQLDPVVERQDLAGDLLAALVALAQHADHVARLGPRDRVADGGLPAVDLTTAADRPWCARRGPRTG